MPEENQLIVQAFLAAHPDFALHTSDYLELRPHLHGTDEFFAAVLERV